MSHPRARRPLHRVLATLVGCALLTAGCGDDADSGGSGGGDAVRISIALPLESQILEFPEGEGAAMAAEKRVNADGGIDGRDLEVIMCDTKLDPNTELNCARQAVKDKVSAVVNPLFLANATAEPVTAITQAGIPIVGSAGTSPTELVDDKVFLLGSGLPGWLYGAVAATYANGAENVSLLVSQGAVYDFGGSLMKDAMQLAGETPVNYVTVDATADPTLATAVAKVTSGGTDGVALDMTPQDALKAVAALRQSGFDGVISGLSPSFPDAVVKALGDAAEGVYTVNNGTAFLSDDSNAGIAEWKADMKKYAPDAALTDVSMQTYWKVRLFAEVAERADGTSAADILKEMNSISDDDPIDLGVVEPYSIAGRESPLPDFPRILNPTVVYGVITDGVITPVSGQFEDPFQALADHAQ